MGFTDGGRGGGCSLLAGRRVDCQGVDMKDNFEQRVVFLVQGVKLYTGSVRDLGTLMMSGLFLK